MSFRSAIFRPIYAAFCATGKPIGGWRPRRMYDVLGRLAYDRPEFRPFRNRWGHEMMLSPYYHIDRNILNFGTYDEQLHLAIERMIRPGMVCMDVGANLGEVALHMAARTGRGGRVYAFEPVPSILKRLESHVKMNAYEQVVQCMAIALSDRTGQIEISAPDEEKDNQGLGSIVNLTGKAGPVRTRVRTMRLDDFVAEEKITRIDLMKIDIQGAEVALIEGGKDTLSKMKPDLLMEISPEDLRCAGQNSRQLAEMVESLGYSIYELSDGEPARELRAKDMPEDFAATNVLCRRRL